jgi:hypothetical protein
MPEAHGQLKLPRAMSINDRAAHVNAFTTPCCDDYITGIQSSCDEFDKDSPDENLNAVDGAADWGFIYL